MTARKSVVKSGTAGWKQCVWVYEVDTGLDRSRESGYLKSRS